MSKITVTEPTTGFRCTHCEKEFRKESTLLAHVCEQKRRYREREEVGVKLGLQAYLRFYEITQGSAKLKTWDDFAASAYYRAFVKFGRYCQQTRVVNFLALVDWLINNNIKLDRWCSDATYTRYLHQYVRQENIADALTRAIECSIDWGERTSNPSSDYLRYGNDNTICYDIDRGRVTAWILYNCDSGREFLDRINPDQVSLIYPWIDPEFWQKRFQDYPADREYVQEMLKQAGW